MPIAIDAISNAAGSTTWSHTVGAGSDRLLLVMVGTHKDTAVSSVTYGGSSLTLAKSEVGTFRRAEIYYMINPPLGTANVVVNGTFSYGVVASAMSLTGTNQTTPIRSTAGKNGTSSTPYLDISSAVGDLVADVVALISSGSSAFTPGSGQTERFDLRYSSSSNVACAAGSTKEGTASVTTSWTVSGVIDYNYAMASVSIRPTDTDISEDFTINDTMTAGFLREESLAEGLTIDDAMTAGFTLEDTVSDGVAIDDKMDVQVDTGIAEGMSVNDNMAPQIDYRGGPLAESVGLGSSIDAEFVKPIQRYKFPYRAKGKHLTITFRNAHPGETLTLLDVASTILPMTGQTNSNKTQYRAQGNHLTIRFRNNTLNEILHLLYCSMTFQKVRR